MVAKGRLKDIPFLKLLMNLYTGKSTGILRLTNGPEVKIVYVSKGKPIFSASNSPSDRMGAMVLRLGLVTEEQLDTALKEVMKTGNRLGTVLVNMGIITPEQLFDLVIKQVSEIIYSIFELDDAEYNFIENAHFSNEVITLDLSMWTLMIEGIKRKLSPDKLKETIGPANAILLTTPGMMHDLGMIKGTDGEKAYNLMDGTRTLNEIIADSGMGELKAIQTVALLKLLGFIFQGEGKKETVATSSLMSEIEQKLDQFPTMNLFEKLGLDVSASKEQILSAFTSLSKKYNPDKFVDSEFKEVKPLALKLYNNILEAFTVLYKDSTRGKYIDEINDQEKSVLFAESDPILARENFEKGKNFVNSRNYKEAYHAFKNAIINDPSISEYYTAQAILESMGFEGHTVDIDAAEKLFLKAIELNTAEARNYYYLGVIYKNKEDYKTARGYFLKALVHNPDHRESKKQLELLDKVA
ncbi:MAG: tetratricopeptide repeat protein [Deltaproteobacteria bacterium]|nr:tetratricopeptide repeat protein [Deltaproteobacteria bacterium]MCL5278083.1 tetratricopeptide repeat protein [Deltaproteobacteria bacterium]